MTAAVIVCTMFAAELFAVIRQLRKTGSILRYGKHEPEKRGDIKKHCFAADMLLLFLFLTALGAESVCGSMYPFNDTMTACKISAWVWPAACVLLALFLIMQRIYWRTQSVPAEGIIVSSERAHTGRSSGVRQTVTYRAEGEQFTFSEVQTGYFSKYYQNGQRIPVRYLKRAPFAAECADRIGFLPWACAGFMLLFPAMRLYFLLTGG